MDYFKVPAAKEQLFSRVFPGQNYYFPWQSIPNLKIINQDTYEKGYHIYSIHDQSWNVLWYSLPLTPQADWFTNFYLNLN